ncbi:hypothetical protein QWY28_17290 [Nocardioides sp. SOB77]|uniref:Uncharacterized protein n=1 Tax=Nocardioides oceani TaxID=3058369 RepID=A0ABT8FJE0_9ACTN|nr:hypothetical protein [Nocardioides oceani]MDN4174719.1 hypothetical protein [Nocardioides oceani]
MAERSTPDIDREKAWVPDGRVHAWHEPTLERASRHGCLDEDVETGSPVVCGACATPAGQTGAAR